MSVFENFMSRLGVAWPRGADQREAGEGQQPNTEMGWRTRPEDAAARMYMQMMPDFALRAKIVDIRRMDEEDGRVKKLHTRTARAAVKGGLRLKAPSSEKRIHRAWRDFERRLHLDRREKLESDMRGLMMEGNLPLQWVISLGDRPRVVAAVRMPTETIVPQVDESGRFKDPAKAYVQQDLMAGRELAAFALWQLTLVRLEPKNYDDFGSLGRPYLDATRKPWKQLMMTEEDLVVRRRTRAAQRMHHNLPGALKEQVAEYRAEVEQDQAEGNWRDYYTNREKAGVSPVGGDANLDQIADVGHLVDTFFAGGPAPKGLFGYPGDLNRDILEDLKRDYYDEVDAMQDVAGYVYQAGFELDLLLQGINPAAYEFKVQYAERLTETPNQRADRALKYQALGVPREMVWETAGLDPAAVRKQREAEAKEYDPYPDDNARPEGGDPPRVSITPGNERKGDSATSITN